MDEQETTKKDEPEKTTTDTDEGDKYETTPVIERARVEREAMEKATAEAKIENDRRETIMAKQVLGGDADAGGTVPEPKKETEEEYAEKVLKGEANPLKDDGFI